MPGPTTELLNDELKELRGDLHKVQLELKDEIHHVAVSVAELKTHLLLSTKVATWGITIIAGTLITSTIGSIWWASKINTKVDGLELRFDKLEGSVAKILEQTRPK
jgi:hypothetical protein